jgi:hypothetical protein
MEMKKSDFLDRLTILNMKARLDDSASLELTDYIDELDEVLTSEPWTVNGVELICAIMQLAEANAKIWLTEAAIRKEFPDDPSASGELDLEEVGRRAIQIRAYNRLRIEARKVIDAAFGETPDNKVDHASQ